jgi:hypothetical protein
MLLSRHQSVRSTLLPVTAVLLFACSPAVVPSSPAAPGSFEPNASALASPAESAAAPQPSTGTYPPNWESEADTPINLELFTDCGFCTRPEGFLLELPQFRLYANGVAVFRKAGSAQGPYRWAQLTDDATDALLRHALDAGGIRNARPRYPGNADDAGGYLLKFTAFYLNETPNKTVHVDRWIGNQPDPDGAIRRQLLAFVELLNSFDAWAADHGVASQQLAPWAYTAALLANEEAGEGLAWPWNDLQPADFADREGLSLARLTPQQAAAVTADRPEGPGLAVRAPDGTRNVVVIREVLPGGDVPGAFGLRPDTAALAVTDGLRMRSGPEISDASLKLQPLLRKAQAMYVVDGPVEGSGYAWYQVYVPSANLVGWVAAASKTGEPWVAPVAWQCTLGASPQAITAQLSYELMHVACFRGRQFTFEGRIDTHPMSAEQRKHYCPGAEPVARFAPPWLNDRAHCDFGLRPMTDDRDTGSYDLSSGSVFHPKARDSVRALMARSVTTGMPIHVRVSGHLDDPDARSCTRADLPAVVASLRCRRIFVITEVLRLE